MKIKNIKIASIALASLAVLMLIAYYALIRPMTNNSDNYEPLELLDGEVAISDKVQNFYVFEPIKRDAMRSIQVSNEYGKYTVYRDTNGAFQLENYYGLSFNDKMISRLVVSTGTPVALMRVVTDATDEDLKEYGLDDPQASWTVTATDGKKYTMYVGDALVNGGGYYAKYSSRGAIYILSTSIGDTVLKPLKTIIKPLLVGGITKNNYFYAEDFTVRHGEELFVRIERVTSDEEISKTGQVEHRLVYPLSENGDEYTVNDTVYYNSLSDLVMLEAEEVAFFMPTDEELESVGLDDPDYYVEYTAGGITYKIIVSALQPDGYYYAVSNMSGWTTVCKVREVFFEWLERGKFSWIMTNPFYVSILKVSRIKVHSKVLGGGFDVDFTLRHGVNSDGDAILDITENVSGTFFPNSDKRMFQQYYMNLLNITNQQFADLTDEDKAALMSDDSKLVMTMVYEDTDGAEHEYKFYRYYKASTGYMSSGKIFVVVDGVGEFYTTNDVLEKIASDTDRLLRGLDIDAYGAN